MFCTTTRNGTFTDVSEKAHVAARKNVGHRLRHSLITIATANLIDGRETTSTLIPPLRLRRGAAFVHVEGRSGDVRATRAAWAKNILYHNLGNGVFEDVTTKAHIDQTNGHYSFSVSTLDYDDDGWPDIFVAATAPPAFFITTIATETFSDVAVVAGAAFNDDGRSRPAWFHGGRLRRRRQARHFQN